MQEGLYSLFQMAKTSAVLTKLSESQLPFFSLLTDPTTGGVTASFAMLGDVTLAEPGALICFAGPRVIEQNLHIKLPEGSVSSEFVLQHGMIDAVIHRRDLRSTLARLLRLYSPSGVRYTPFGSSRSSSHTTPREVKIPLPKRMGENDGLRPGI